jgi:hypothetical protein
MACIRCCLVTGSRDSLPVCARTRSYSYAFPYCVTESHPYFPSAHRAQRRYHVKNTLKYNNPIHKRPTTVSSNAQRKNNTRGKSAALFCNIVTPQVLHTNFNMSFTSLHFNTHKYSSRHAPIYPLHCTTLHFTSLHFNTHKYSSRHAPIYSLHCTTLHFTSLHFTIVLDSFNTLTFPTAHHINHFPNTFSKIIWFTG